jgi:histidinol phosphatase-like PHP family hydrolase
VTRSGSKKRALTWRTMDLHLHTPASSDYQEPQATYLDILQRAEARGLDLIAFTDHNTVAGYRRLRDEIAELELLERLQRLRPDEAARLKEYRRLLNKILVLPGFEFTATFGFHILAIFPPETPVRDLDHLLLSLKIPSDQLDRGSATVGASADVLTAYRLLDEAGGLVIAAHANSSNGVAMRGFPFGGQTKIAYTQDPHLHALEVTDLEKGRRGTAAFFNGSKPEYPRRMHCLQGSDAHRLKRDPHNTKNLGVGDRATDVQLEEVSFEALRQLLLGRDFARTRPHTSAAEEEFDYVQQAREEGANIVQSFHESMAQRGGHLYAVIADVCAFANTNGGTIYVGVSADPKQRPAGVDKPAEAVQELRSAIDRMLTPSLDCTVDVAETKGKAIIRVLVPRGDDPPYAIDDNKIYVREEAETSLAVRDEIVQLVLRGQPAPALTPEAAPSLSVVERPAAAAPVAAAPTETSLPMEVSPPRTGVEIVATEERDGRKYHTVRDLRNGSIVKNVTRASARKLWHYAITEHESGALEASAVTWHGDLGLWKKTHRGGVTRYDLVQRADKSLRVYYGVTEDGVHGAWKQVVGGEEE